MSKEEKTYDLRVRSRKPLINPDTLRKVFPITKEAKQTVLDAREEIKNILLGKSSKIIGLLGPCSIHSEEQALLNGRIIKTLQKKVKDTMILVMRTYFEKPRTISGWKGLINDPGLDKSYDINNGLAKARKILLDLNEMGVPCGTEVLSQLSPECLGGLLSWTSIGARTSESQVCREWASALSTAVGFKNGTNGQIDVAINAVKAASEECTFPGKYPNGKPCIITSTGNPLCHVILRGGGGKVNYSQIDIARAKMKLLEQGLTPNIFIDCSHGNSGNNPCLQAHAWNNSINQIIEGEKCIIGLALENNVVEGKQKFDYGQTKKTDLNHVQSITDKCIGQSETKELILLAHEKLSTSNKIMAA